jgi:hypothetical protein
MAADVFLKFVQELDSGKGKLHITEERQRYKTTLMVTQAEIGGDRDLRADALEKKYPFLLVAHTNQHVYTAEDFEGDDKEMMF